MDKFFGIPKIFRYTKENGEKCINLKVLDLNGNVIEQYIGKEIHKDIDVDSNIRKNYKIVD
jgi:hypothetical protein